MHARSAGSLDRLRNLHSSYIAIIWSVSASYLHRSPVTCPMLLNCSLVVTSSEGLCQRYPPAVQLHAGIVCVTQDHIILQSV